MQEKSKRESEKWRALNLQLLAQRRKGSGAKECRQPLEVASNSQSQQGSEDFNSTTAWNWILPMTWISLEEHATPGPPPKRRSGWQTPWFWLGRTQRRGTGRIWWAPHLQNWAGKCVLNHSACAEWSQQPKQFKSFEFSNLPEIFFENQELRNRLVIKQAMSPCSF